MSKLEQLTPEGSNSGLGRDRHAVAGELGFTLWAMGEEQVEDLTSGSGEGNVFVHNRPP